jgi:hypothetical protein
MSLIKLFQKNWVDVLLVVVVIALVIQIAAPELFTVKFWRSCGKEKFADDVTVETVKTPVNNPVEKPTKPPVPVDTSSVDTSSVDTKTVDTSKSSDSTESKATTDTSSLETKVNKAVDVATNAALASVAAAQQSTNSASEAAQSAKQATDVAQTTPPVIVVAPPQPQPPVIVAPPRPQPPVIVAPPRPQPPVVVAPPQPQPPVVVAPPQPQPPVVVPKSIVAQLKPSLQVRSAQSGPVVANQAELMQNRSTTVVDVPQGNSSNVIPENMYLLDGANKNFNFANSRCSKSCCSQQWPLPFALKSDPAVCNSKEKYIPTGLSCSNSWDDSGCLCVSEEQARFYGNRAGNA